MARRYSGKKGKAGSKKPTEDSPKPWLTYTKEEVEQLITKLAKSGNSTAKIGSALRDSYGIPDVKKHTGKTVLKIMKENKLSPKLPEDLTNLIKRQLAILKHLESNKQDKPASRGLTLTESKIRRLSKYYKRKGVLPKDWQYNKENIKISI